MFCPKCGNELKKTDAFCASCGARVKKEDTTDNTKQTGGKTGSGAEHVFTGIMSTVSASLENGENVNTLMVIKKKLPQIRTITESFM